MVKNKLPNINSLEALNRLELQIQVILKKIPLGDALYSLHNLKNQHLQLNATTPEFLPFLNAGVALFAIRFCLPSKIEKKIKNYDLRHLVNLSLKYLQADPITFDKDLEKEFIESNPVFLMLRLVSHQFPFEPNIFSQFARPLILFDEIPRQLNGLPNIPKFDFEKKFQEINDVSLIDFIITGFCIYIFSSHFSISRRYFKVARKKGLNLPDDCSINKILLQLSTNKSNLINLYEKRKNEDDRFKAYNFNPLIQYPIIKPCQNKQFSTLERDFIHAPVPDLIASRISSGIFYQMFNCYGQEFSQYFGYIFERYVGIILQECISSEMLISEEEKCISSEMLISEEEIRTFYPINKGKAPDWIVQDGSTLILFECKATRFSRAAQAIASEDHINSSLVQVKKGLKQLASFISACQQKTVELSRFHDCNTFIPIVVSLEPLYLINSHLFREHLDSLLIQEGVNKFDWRILSIDELELLQVHLSTDYKLIQMLDDLLNETCNNLLIRLSTQTGKKIQDSFLYSKQEEIFQRLGVSNGLKQYLALNPDND
ncbi:hypothetical protein myaer87_22090 [Microcystis aeruginosa NIES-87]|nr:hypothetical protein myaer87_22090 [Microcystis aeruginosa NIES-87]